MEVEVCLQRGIGVERVRLGDSQVVRIGLPGALAIKALLPGLVTQLLPINLQAANAPSQSLVEHDINPVPFQVVQLGGGLLLREP